MRSAGGLINLRVVPENEADLPILESFFSHAARPPLGPKVRCSDLQVANPRPARPQTNPHLDPLVYDPFPGIPIALGRTPPKLPEAKSKSSTPGEPSQALAAMELSDDGAEDDHRNEDHPKTPSSDIGSKGSSSSAWSFLEKSKGQNPNASSSSSSPSSSQSFMPLLPAPVALKSPPAVVKLETESESDVQIIETKRRKSKRLGGAGESEGKAEEEVEVKEKRKKKRRDVAESSVIGEEGAHDGNENSEDGDEEAEAEAERKRKKKERKKRRNKNPDNDGDIEMESDFQPVNARPTKKKTKKSRHKKPLSNSESPILMQSPPPKTKKKKGKEKSKERHSEPRSNDPPPIKPSKSGSEIRKSTKRKHSDSGDNNDEVDGEGLSRQRERLKKRINQINMEKHELRVEEEELKAKLLRLDFTTRQLDTGAIRAHCVCSACKKYGHKKNSVICEMHPDAIRIAAWRGR